MDRLRFLLTSDQLELLLAFETSEGLGQLAERMAKDPSVVSRNLQRIAEDSTALKKVRGRWELTPLGAQLNQQTRAFLESQLKLFSESSLGTKPAPSLCTDGTALVVINAQNGLFDATQEGRNNSEAEKNILRLLNHWRERSRKVVHVKHVSDNPKSIFYRKSEGVEFLPALAPVSGEHIVEKKSSSAFVDTSLDSLLASLECPEVLLAGFTANECIDATARDAAAKGFTTIVAGDATATFDLRDPSGKLVKAERIHRLTLLNIGAFYARVMGTGELVK